MLSIKKLNHTYSNGVNALQNINLSINNGMFGLLGPNGAGKSTLMRTIATLQSPTCGSILFNGSSIIQQPEKLRQVLGYLPQDFGVYPRGSALELLDHIAVLKGIVEPRIRKKMIEGLLVETNLYHERKRNVASFSGGMRQRFGIAQALLGQPKLIIVDEPTAGLDPEERNRFHNLLAEISQEVVVILSTHIVEDVAHLCSKMAIMTSGKIVSKGAPGNLISHFQDRIWKKAITKSELNRYQQGNQKQNRNGSQYQVISEQRIAGQRHIRVVSDSQPADDFVAAKANLEDVYFASIQLGSNAQPESKIQPESKAQPESNSQSGVDHASA
jgi:ABC-2 type transport system ATP-binding protein